MCVPNYLCGKCDAGFVRKDSLQSHLNQHKEQEEEEKTNSDSVAAQAAPPAAASIPETLTQSIVTTSFPQQQPIQYLKTDPVLGSAMVIQQQQQPVGAVQQHQFLVPGGGSIAEGQQQLLQTFTLSPMKSLVHQQQPQQVFLTNFAAQPATAAMPAAAAAFSTEGQTLTQMSAVQGLEHLQQQPLQYVLAAPSEQKAVFAVNAAELGQQHLQQPQQQQAVILHPGGQAIPIQFDMNKQ